MAALVSGKTRGNAPRLRARQIAAALVSISLLAGCTSLPKGELQALGTEVAQDKIDFAPLGVNAKRAKAAYASPAQIRTAYPKTIRVATPGGRDVPEVLRSGGMRKPNGHAGRISRGRQSGARVPPASGAQR